MYIDPYADEKRIPFIVAEIGINHNGDLEIAKKMISMARDCGADAVKFQKRTIDVVYSKEFLDSPRHSPWGITQRDQKQGLEFNKDGYDAIDKHCKELGIYWFASSWDEKSQEFLRHYEVPFNKIASAMLTYKTLVEMIAGEGKHTFISTGMSKINEIDRVVDIFRKNNCPFTLMHCVSVYPCPDAWCNVKMVETLKKRYSCPVGYSGHENGVGPTTVAVALGAVALERHITLDRSMYGADQAVSLEKRGLELVVRDSREVKKTLGTGEKIMISEEEKIKYKLRYFRDEEFNWD